MAEAVSLTERIIKDPDFDLLVQNAQQFLAETPKPTLEQRILADPDFDLLLENANKYLRQTKKPKRAKTKLALATAAGLVGVASLASVAGPKISVAEKPGVQAYPTPGVTISPTPKLTETPQPTPTPEVKAFKTDIFSEKIAPKIYEEAQRRRHERYANDPNFRQLNFALAENKIITLVAGSAIRLRDPQTGEITKDPLTDSIQLLIYDIPTSSLYVISFPRDLYSPEVWQKTKDIRNSRINQAVVVGGAELLRQAIQDATRLPVDFSIQASSDILKDFIDETLGTIEVNLDKELRDDKYPTEDYGFKKIYYPKGVNILNGEQAVEVARSRHGSSDYDRSQRQQQIVQAWLSKFLQSGNLLDKFNKLRMAILTRNIWYTSIDYEDLAADFDLDSLFFDALKKELSAIPAFLSRVKIAEMPTIFSSGLTNRNLVAGAGIYGTAITKIAEGNLYSTNPIQDYWRQSQIHIERFLTQNIGEPPSEEVIELTIPPKEQRILYPKELSYNEVKAWIGRLRDGHDAVITESLFTQELTSLPQERREKMMKAIAKAHAKALIEHYGDTEAIIGLDPGHGGSEIGSAGRTPEDTTLLEKDLTWQLCLMMADEIYEQSLGKFMVVFLRPQNPLDQDLDGDGFISPVERLQKRKALLLSTEQFIRKYGQHLGENIVFLSVHFNGSENPNQKGTEVFWPNELGMPNPKYRESSMKLAHKLQENIVEAIREEEYDVIDRGAREDPDKRSPLGNSEVKTGPYVVLGSPKLDRDLQR